MPLIPDRLIDRIQWFEQRIDSWKAAPASIGLTQAQANALSTAVAKARTDYDNAPAARIAAKNATVAQNSTVREMSSLGADAVRFIRAFAEGPATPAARDAVYEAASIPPPADPVPSGAPKPPTDVIADPNADGTQRRELTDR